MALRTRRDRFRHSASAGIDWLPSDRARRQMASRR